MSPVSKILYKSFIRPFYRENAGTFVFVFTMFFFIVGTVDGAGLFKYHYTLIKGILHIKLFLAGILLLWIFYVRKCALFIIDCMRQPAYQFLFIFRILPKQQQYRLFFVTNVILFLPMTIYVLLVIAEGIYLGTWPSVILIVIFMITACLFCPYLHIRLLNNPGHKTTGSTFRLNRNHSLSVFYPNILLRSVFKLQKLVWLGIKLFTCSFLYFMAVNNTLTTDDTRITFLFFSFGILANGVFVNRLRMFEYRYLAFYRSLPVPRIKRLIQYACFTLLLLLPEIITLGFITPAHLGVHDAVAFGGYAVTTLLLLIAISFIRQMALKHFVRILLLLFFAGYFIMLCSGIPFICILFMICAVLLFHFAYYQFEATAS
ncbi:hypothetical protein A8C56_12130 [Niabella ginsenosidivorans]|uniref:Uncharacterized protein n=1 Tax=Niabella ginsenosidivorans TaxID=1176587 RepID=A0A1A9I1T7_9BACT|nr:hypothetical protein [Niabella ginsenosidivorans]ANH81627.1 hypothetical protein A8C56_12130 [Niabella ginsenosidivorans]